METACFVAERSKSFVAVQDPLAVCTQAGHVPRWPAGGASVRRQPVVARLPVGTEHRCGTARSCAGHGAGGLRGGTLFRTALGWCRQKRRLSTEAERAANSPAGRSSRFPDGAPRRPFILRSTRPAHPCFVSVLQSGLWRTLKAEGGEHGPSI